MSALPLRRRALALALAAATLAGLAATAVARAAPPQEAQQPTLEGTFRSGSTISTTNGTWLNAPTSFTYRWYRCNARGTGCSQIADQTRSSYRLRSADVGRTIVADVTARNADGSATANTRPSPVIADNVVPRNIQRPSISGTPAVGATLTADPGTWTGAPTFTYFWRRCNATGSSCSDTGARGRTYGVRSDDVGRTIRVRVRASNPRGRTTATSAPTAVVPAPPPGTGPAVPVSSISLPDRLVLSGVSFSPTFIRDRDTIVTLEVRVTDTRGRLVQGAPVLATGIPFGRVSDTPEVGTDSRGIATITFRPTARLPMQRGASVVFFLRARKPGENPLAGVSTRRLVQITVRPG